MTIIKARLKDQALTVSTAPVVASGGVEEDVVTFEFDSTWAEYVKKAVFYRDESNVYHVDVGSDNTAVIPWEVLQQAGHMYFGVFGTKGSEVKTSTVAKYRVERGAITIASGLMPTPDIFSDVIANTAARHSHGNKTVLDGITYVPANVSDVFEYTNNPMFTNVFDSVAIEYGKILDSGTGDVTDVSANLATTDFIPCKANDVFRVNEDFPIYNSGSSSVVMYNGSKERVMGIKSSAIVENGYYVKALEFDANGYVRAFQVLRPSATTAYIRICNNTTVIGNNPILTINEEIAYKDGYGSKLNPKVRVDQSQIVNAPQKNGWSILPNERLNIAYSSIGRKPINTVEHFTDAATNFGYNALKCDVRPTSDGELVCCHDAGFTFDGSGYITAYDSNNQTVIHDVTAATVLGYSFSTGEHPCLVGDYLNVCRKYGKIAFVTIRNEYMDVVIPKLLEELKKHNMTYSTIINCMTYNSLVTWRNYDQSVMINYTLNAGVAIDQSEIDRAIGLGYCSLCGFGLNSSVLEPNHACDFEYARANGIRLLQAIAYREGSPEACYAMGYDGCQIAIPWGEPAGGGVSEETVQTMIDAAISAIPVYNGEVV